MKLQSKYFLIFFTLFVVLALALSITTYFLSNHILLDKYEEISAGSLSYLLDITDKELDQLSSTFIFIANNPTVHKRIATDYEAIIPYEKLTNDIAVTDMFGAMSSFEVFNSIKFLYIKGINGEEYLYKPGVNFLEKDVLLRDLDIENIDIGKLQYHGLAENINPYSQSDYILKFTKALTDTYGKRLGIVYFEVDADYYATLYKNEYMEMDTEIYLVDGDGYIVYHTTEYMIGRSFDLVDTKGVVIDKPLGKYGWRLISESPVEQIYKESDSIIRVTMIMAVVSILLGLILIMFITSQIVKPIKRLTKAMADVAKGDLEVQVECKTNDEVGELSYNFNQMTRQLHDNLEDKLAYNKAINDAEYKALQAQINPHFMYNSLNALKWLAGIKKANNIIDMVNALWTLLRKTSSIKGQMITLESELEVIEAYCTIQQVRYKGKFEIINEVKEEHLQQIIPKYILQPFVENAIFHGIEPKKGPGIITLRSKIVANDLELSVEDDGVGIDNVKKIQILVDDAQQQDSGLNNIGVKNINERLMLLYGPEYSIHVESSLNIGTTMSIRIPLDGEVKGETHV